VTRRLGLALALLLPVVPAAAAALACEKITVYTERGCPHCAMAQVYLSRLAAREPALRIELREVRGDPAAFEDLERISREWHLGRLGVPTFDVCGEVIVGFDEPQTTGALIEDLIHGRTRSVAERLRVAVPVWGEIGPADLGLPLFTIALGLVDGFNPCAMWVLLFLLSLLVNVPRRSRILLVAGSFVLASGLVYFAFMAAWLNVFLFAGYSRTLQIVLGTVAALIGIVHVKDFFALHRGISFSIPDSAKPGIYRRVSAVVRAENLPAALAGIATLAVLVNLVELLCTAGLPAIYTQVLSYYPLSDAAYYGYLLLYNLAYVFDDGLMVAIAVATLGKRRLEERAGRWLKLLSGVVIFGLGAILIAAPEALML
jgi:glutaredoxin